MSGQSHSFKNFNDSNGLPSSEVYQIIQDDNKFIWFATDNGVVRYNGSAFRLFDQETGLPDPVVFGFYKERTGRIWFRSFSGALSYFENDSILSFPHNDRTKVFLKKSILSDIATDSIGQLWMSSSVNGAIGIIDSAGHLLTLNQLSHSLFFKKIDSTQIIMGFTGSPTTLKKFTDGEKVIRLNIADTTQFNAVTSHVFWKGYHFFSINRNVFRFDGSSVVSVLESRHPVINLSLDRENYLWVGFLNDGVTRFADADLRFGIPFQDLSHRSVTTVLQDSEGGYWFSTLDRGVYYFPNLSIKNYAFDQNSKVISVSAYDQTVFTGNYLGQVIALDAISKKSKVIRRTDAAILTVHCDHRGLIWVSSVDETFIMGKDGETIRQFPGLKRVKDFFEDDHGSIWAINQDGIIKFDRNFNIVLEKRMAIWPRSIFVDGNSVYLAGLSGLHRFDSSLRHNMVIRDFERDKISVVIKLDDNLLAVGTLGNGLWLLKNNSAKPIKARQFFAENVFSLVRRGKYLWASTEKGLIRANIGELFKGNPDYQFLSQSSLPGFKNNFLQMVGEKLFAFSEASYSEIPSEINQFSSSEPQASFSRLMVNDRPHSFVDAKRLRHFENNLKIALELVSFNNQDFQLRHRLNNGAWEEGGKELKFYSLAPGDYHLEVEYLVHGRRWNSIVDYTFIILKPWWDTWYFGAAVVSVLAFLISLGFYARIRSLKEKRLRELDIQHKIRREKERIAKDLHDNIGSQLTSLSLGLNNLERRNGVDTRVVDLLRTDLRTIMAEFRDTIWAINKDEITLHEFSDKVRNIFWRIQQRGGSLDSKVSLFTHSKEIMLKPVQAINLFRITQEAISNSINHSLADKMTVHISFDASQTLAINISDNGRGFDVQSNFSDGHHGLKNMKKRAEELNAILDIASTKEKGTNVVIRMPFYGDD